MKQAIAARTGTRRVIGLFAQNYGPNALKWQREQQRRNPPSKNAKPVQFRSIALVLVARAFGVWI